MTPPPKRPREAKTFRLTGLVQHPLAWIVAAVAFGFAIAITVVWKLYRVCASVPVPDALTSAAKMGYRVAGRSWTNSQLCNELMTDPPWLQLSSVVVGPAVLLTWYWREQKRRDNQSNAELTHEQKREDILIAQKSLAHAQQSAQDLRQQEAENARLAQEAAKPAQESAIAERYKAAAELLGSQQEMTRITGLFALWDVARESPAHRTTVSRTLAAYIRTSGSSARIESEMLVDVVIAGVAPDENGQITAGSDIEAVHPDAKTGAQELRHAQQPVQTDVQTAATLLFDPIWRAEWKVSDKRIHVDVRSSHLAGCDLKGADLSGANLTRAHLAVADLTHAILEGADLTDARLSGASLNRAILDGADLKRAYLAGGNLAFSRMSGANFCEAHLEGVNFCGAKLENANFESAYLEGADFSHAHLKDADFSHAHLERSRFFRSHLEGARLSYAHLEGAILASADLTGANLTRAHLEGACLMGASLNRARLDNEQSVELAKAAGALCWETVEVVDPAS
jgi:uncharacterized protein YjbI with pentapeptide repeats